MQPASLALSLLHRFLTDERSGVNAALTRLAEGSGDEAPLLDPAAIRINNASVDLLEKSGTSRYPCLNLTCERMRNDLREKFRSFSGSVELSAEVRVSADRIGGGVRDLHSYVGAVTAVLDSVRGQWSAGVYFSGSYEVCFAAARAGGKRYVQTAKIALSVNVTI